MAMTGETMVPANGVDLCVETFGEPSDPPLLLIAGAGSSMDRWDDEFCRRLAAGGRYVIRYDHRDTGRSTAFPPGAPPYTRVDLADDALGLLDALGERQAHLVGFGLGGELAQRLAVDHPSRPLSLTLLATGPDPADQPDPAGWRDRKTAVDRLIAEIQRLGGPFTVDEPQLRRLAERVFDRTTDMTASQVNHRTAPAGPPIDERLGDISVPALVLYGTVDPLVAMAHAEALARAIPDARLVKLEGVGHEFPPPAVWSQVIDEILKHTA
jgi:pimeloyl-ACP methyl ester carboxylesterase